mgnify:CR=1 FL=1
MKNTKISRRSFLLGLAACSAAGVLTACSGSSEPASSASTAPDSPASSAASEVTAAPFLTVEDFPALDGSTACIPLMAQMLADTTGMDLEEAQSIISVSTTAYAWESFGLYNTDTKMLVVYEAPDSVKEELETANVQLEQKPIGVDALVFIVNEDNPVTNLTQQQLRDIYAGKLSQLIRSGMAHERREHKVRKVVHSEHGERVRPLPYSAFDGNLRESLFGIRDRCYHNEIFFCSRQRNIEHSHLLASSHAFGSNDCGAARSGVINTDSILRAPLHAEPRRRAYEH